MPDLGAARYRLIFDTSAAKPEMRSFEAQAVRSTNNIARGADRANAALRTLGGGWTQGSKTVKDLEAVGAAAKSTGATIQEQAQKNITANAQERRELELLRAEYQRLAKSAQSSGAEQAAAARLASEANTRLGTQLGTIGKINASMVAMGRRTASSLKLGGLAALYFTVKGGTETLKANTQAQAQLEAGLRKSGRTVGITLPQMEALAHKLQNVGGAAKSSVMQVEGMLLPFQRIRNEVGAGNNIFTRATKAIFDVSTAMGRGLKPTAIALAKALQDPTKYLNMLSRSGVTFTKQQQDMIKSLVETGHLLQAQRVILDQVAQRFGGRYAAAGATFVGQLKIAKEQLKESAATITQSFLPAFESVTKVIQKAGGVMAQHTDLVKALVFAYLGFKTVTLLAAIFDTVSTRAIALGRWLYKLGPDAEKGAAQADAAIQSIGASAIVVDGEVATLNESLLGLGGAGATAGAEEAAGAVTSIGAAAGTAAGEVTGLMAGLTGLAAVGAIAVPIYLVIKNRKAIGDFFHNITHNLTGFLNSGRSPGGNTTNPKTIAAQRAKRAKSEYDLAKRYIGMQGVTFNFLPNGDAQAVGPDGTVYHTFKFSQNTPGDQDVFDLFTNSLPDNRKTSHGPGPAGRYAAGQSAPPLSPMQKKAKQKSAQTYRDQQLDTQIATAQANKDVTGEVRARKAKIAYDKKYEEIQRRLLKTDSAHAKQHYQILQSLLSDRQSNEDQIASLLKKKKKKKGKAVNPLGVEFSNLETTRLNALRSTSEKDDQKANLAEEGYLQRLLKNKKLVGAARERVTKALSEVDSRLKAIKKKATAQTQQGYETEQQRLQDAVLAAQIKVDEQTAGTPKYATALAAEKHALRVLINYDQARALAAEAGSKEREKWHKRELDARKKMVLLDKTKTKNTADFAAMARTFLSETASFWSSFGSNVFTGSPGSRSLGVGSNIGTSTNIPALNPGQQRALSQMLGHGRGGPDLLDRQVATHGYATGGVVPGQDGRGDVVPAMLSPGEVVLSRGHVRKLANVLGVPPTPQAVFARTQHFANGGIAQKTANWSHMKGVRFVKGPNGSVQVVNPAGVVYHTYRNGDPGHNFAVAAAMGWTHKGFTERVGADFSTIAKSTPGGLLATGKALGSAATGHPGALINMAKAYGHQLISEARHPLRHPGFTIADLITLGLPAAKAGRLAAGAAERFQFSGALTRAALGKSSLRMTPEEALRRYVMEGPGINTSLRKSRSKYTGHYEHTVAKLDKLMKQRAILAENEISVYRGLPAHVLFGKKPGDIIHDPGYLSTSLDKYVAQNFGDRSTFKYGAGRVLEIKVPPGAKGINMADWGEQEILFPRGSKLKILGENLARLIHEESGQLSIGRRVPTPAAQHAAEMIQRFGGGTFRGQSLAEDTTRSGYFVSIGKHERALPKGDVTGRRVQSFQEKHAKLLAENPHLRVGGWADEGVGYLDVTKRFKNMQDALAFGRQEGQLAIWDVKKGRSIPTGLTDKEARAIKAALKRNRGLGRTDFEAIAESVLSLKKMPASLAPISNKTAMTDRIQAVYEAAIKGSSGKDWYKRTAKRDVQTFADREGITPKQAAQVLAVYSAQATPRENMIFATRAIRQFKAYNNKIKGVRTGVQDRNAEAILRGEPWKATNTNMKTTSYWQNILMHLVPKMSWDKHGIDPMAVTNDRWVAAQFKPWLSPEERKVTAAEHPIFTHAFQEIAKRMGWAPQQVQAASWVTYKARGLMQQHGWSWDKAFKEAKDAYGRGLADSAGGGIEVRDPIRARGTKHRALGGWIPGSGTADNVPTLTTPGELVLNRPEQRRLADLLGIGHGPALLDGTSNLGGRGTVIEKFENHQYFNRETPDLHREARLIKTAIKTQFDGGLQ